MCFWPLSPLSPTTTHYHNHGRRHHPPPTTHHPPPTKHSDRFLDDFLITLRRKLPTTSAAGLSMVASALPALSSGVRLNEVVSDAQARLAAAEAAAAASGAAAEAAYDAPEAVAA